MINSVPAVVVGAELNGLGVVRSLARGRVPTILVDTTRRHAAMWSRRCRTAVVDKLSGQALVDGLLGLRTTLDTEPVLILANESVVGTVSEHRDQLRGAYRFHLPPPDIVSTLRNGARFHEFAVENGLSVPRSVVVCRDTPLEKLSSIPFPAIVKTADADNPEHIHHAATLKEAEALCSRLLESAPELIVQEWIGGPDSNIFFALFHFGHRPDNFQIFAGRKIASTSLMNGNASLCFAAPEVMDSLEPLIARYLDLTDFQGLGSLEFKWDSYQRRYVIVGQTVGRSDWQEEIATLSGVNLPLAVYRDEIDLPPLPSGEVNRTIAWQDSWLRGKRSPALPPDMRVFDGYWRLNDPLPGLIHYAHALCVKIHRQILGRILESRMVKRLRYRVAAKFRIFAKPIFKKPIY